MKCTKCGKDHEVSFKFCSNCGEANPIAASPQQPQPQQPPPPVSLPQQQGDQPSAQSVSPEGSRQQVATPTVMPLEAARERYMKFIGLEVAWVIAGSFVIGFVFRSPAAETFIVGTVASILLLYAIIWYGIRIEMRPWQIVLAVPLHLLLWIPGVLYMFHMTKVYEKTASLNTEPGADVERTEASGVKPDSLTASLPPIPPSETRAAEVKRKKGKYIVALIILVVVLTVVVASIIFWSSDNRKNAYATKAKELLENRSKLLTEEKDTTNAFGEEFKQLSTYTDLTVLRTGCSALADKYIPIYQGYYDRLKSIKDEFALMEPPSEYQQFHNLYQKSCDSFCKALTSSMDGLRLLQSINESTESQINSISATASQYGQEGTDLSQQAEQAWPQ